MPAAWGTGCKRWDNQVPSSISLSQGKDGLLTGSTFCTRDCKDKLWSNEPTHPMLQEGFKNFCFLPKQSLSWVSPRSNHILSWRLKEIRANRMVEWHLGKFLDGVVHGPVWVVFVVIFISPFDCECCLSLRLSQQDYTASTLFHELWHFWKTVTRLQGQLWRRQAHQETLTFSRRSSSSYQIT